MKRAKDITTNRCQRGFTMIELMITVTMVAVLASIAAPSMRTYVLNNRINSASQEVLRTLQAARTEATKRQQNVVVCASANPLATTPTCTTGTPIGWIMFEDTNANFDRASTETLIESHSFDSAKMTMLASGNKAIGYASTGFGVTGGSNAIVMCDSRGNVDSNGSSSGSQSVARGIDIAGTGRARSTKVLSEISTLLSAARINSNCPP